MKLTVNGSEETIEMEKLTVTGLLALKNVKMPEMVSVELNGEILERASFDSVTVKENDIVEFLYFMGGGQAAGFSTRAVHAGEKSSRETGATAVPLYNSAAFAYDSAQELADVFEGRKYGHVYTRISNPTVAVFEQRVNSLEQGRGALAASSGMAAIANTVFTLAGSGDEIVASKSLFGGTLLFFNSLISRFGIKVVYAETEDAAAYAKAVNERTRMIFVETISNPGLVIPDIKGIAGVAGAAGLPLIVDSTVTTPYLFDAKGHGAAVAIHSATKYMTGNGTAIGGILVDTGAFNWKKSSNPLLSGFTAKFGEFGFLAAARKQVMQNVGTCLSPSNAFLHCLGLETLSIRMEKHCANAAELAMWLENHPRVKSVNYPGLAGSRYKNMADLQFGGRYGGILTMTLADRGKCFDFLGRVKLARNLANIGDAKTLVIHPGSTIFKDCGSDETANAGVTGELIRVSVGIEDAADLKEDFEQALS